MHERMKREREEAQKIMDSIGMQQEPADNQPHDDADSQTTEVTPPEKTEVTATPPADSQEIARLNGEVTRLRAQLDDENNQTHRSQALLFKSQRDTARAELAELKEQMKAQPKPEPEPDTTDADYNDMVAEIGEKAAKIWLKDRNKANKVSADEVNRMVEERVKPITDNLEAVNQGQAVTARERFFNDLSAKVPEWKTINGWDSTPQDPKFTAFAFEKVPFQDYTFNDLLNHHYAEGNAAKVAQIFETFKERHAVKTDESAKENGLEQHLEPTKTNRGTQTPTDKSTKPTYTRKEIEEFDKQKRSGTLYGMSREDIAAKSKLYQDAIFEGRVK